ncbi:unnamed protein product [Porites lobata]|uniref:G-protein coupled receptors family 1 profile domain-containing protein n=1 Tax=Porites lobata TaxID=104759 RepID=A0ABN8RJU1_9CNID|nr:unnamed protein product [Porites lobata]
MADSLSSRSSFLITVEVTSLVILNVLSVAGNILVCMSVYKNVRLRTTTNLYIIALAASDLLSAVFVMPIGIGVLITGEWIFGEAICQLHAFFSLFVIYISPVTMGLTAVNRYVRICRSTQQYDRLFSARKSRLLLAIVWFSVACYTVVPRLAGLQAYEFVPGYAQCSIAHLSEIGKTIHYSIVLICFFLTPLIATLFSYKRVAEVIRQHNINASSSISSHEIKISKSLFAVVFAFMICWIPFWIIVVLRRFKFVATMPRSVELLCMFLLYLSNTINPFIYAGMNPVFKKEFRNLLCCGRNRLFLAKKVKNIRKWSGIVSFVSLSIKKTVESKRNNSGKGKKERDVSFYIFLIIMADSLSSRSSFLITVEVTSLVILNVLSLAGNILVCMSVYKNVRLRTTTNLYIIALAASDLLSAVFVMPIGIGVLITGEWIFGEAICQLHAFFSLFVIYISPVTMGLTAVNRYVRICRSTQQYDRLFSARKSRLLLAIVWFSVACYTVVPRLADLQAYEFVPGYAQCSIAHLSEIGKMIHYSIVLICFFLTPLIATLLSYKRVAEVIRQHNINASSSISSHEIKISKSLFAVVFAFMICWIPFWIIVVLRRFKLVATMPRSVELFCMFLLYLSNTINPFIYAGMNPVFKREFRNLLCCGRNRREFAISFSSRKEMSTDEV